MPKLAHQTVMFYLKALCARLACSILSRCRVNQLLCLNQPVDWFNCWNLQVVLLGTFPGGTFCSPAASAGQPHYSKQMGLGQLVPAGHVEPPSTALVTTGRAFFSFRSDTISMRWHPLTQSLSICQIFTYTVAPPDDQILNQSKLCHLVAKYATRTNGVIWWPNLQLMQVVPSGGQICI